MTDAPSILGPHHLALEVRDSELSERFYLGVLGLPLMVRHQDADARHRATWVALGGSAFLALERAAPDLPGRSDGTPGLHCLALRIERSAREAWRERLVRHGLTVERESAFTLYTRDPDGVLVGLSHHPDAI